MSLKSLFVLRCAWDIITFLTFYHKFGFQGNNFLVRGKKDKAILTCFVFVHLPLGSSFWSSEKRNVCGCVSESERVSERAREREREEKREREREREKLLGLMFNYSGPHFDRRCSFPPKKCTEGLARDLLGSRSQQKANLVPGKSWGRIKSWATAATPSVVFLIRSVEIRFRCEADTLRCRN